MKVIVSLLLIISLTGYGQTVLESYFKQEGSFRYGEKPGDLIPLSKRGYTLILPAAKDNLSGTLVMLEDSKPNLQDTSQKQFIQIQQEANAKGLATLYISTGIPLDLYFSQRSLQYVDSVWKDVFTKYKLPHNNIFLLGAMTSGHRALKYIEYCKTGKSLFNPDITGVVLSESAIDWVRQWYECQKQVRDHLSETGFFEGNFITYLFKQYLEASPVTDIEKIIDFSPYSYFDTRMRKPKLFTDLAIRAYTFADTRYWFSAQGKGVYDSNYPDMSGFINEQKLAGNKNAELIVFHSNPDGPLENDLRRQSSTWDLVDTKELFDWIMSRLK